MISAAIFDMDGLLVDSEPFWRKAEIACFAKVGVHLTESDCRDTMGWRLNEVVEYWYKKRPWQSLTPEAMEMDIIETVSHYILTEAEPMPGVAHAIQQCREAGLRTAIASSSPMKLIESVVDRFELRESFDALHSAQYEAFGKPHPAVFLSAARLLKCTPPSCLVFEDSFYGMVAGLAARMKVIAVPAAEESDSPQFGAAHALLGSLEEFNTGLISRL